MRLNSGYDMPVVGFGTGYLDDEAVQPALAHAFAAGYRKLDTGGAYRNETGVGRAIAASGLPRRDLFVTTKVWNTEQGKEATRRALHTSLDRLGLDYVDLYLVHWPAPARGRYVETYATLELLRDEGLVRSIGVSNFQPQHLRRLQAETGTIPAVNQLELHPYLQQREPRRLHAGLGIVTEAWFPLGQGTVLADPVLARIAARTGSTVAQVVLVWHRQHQVVAVPRSHHPDRIRANFAAATLPLLDDADLAAIDALDRGGRLGPHPDEYS